MGMFGSTHDVPTSWARNWASPPLSWHSCWPKKEDVVVEVAEKVISDKKAEHTTMSASRREHVKKENECDVQQLQWEVLPSSHDF